METVQQRITTAKEGYITKDEVARRVKKSARTVERWQKRGIIPFVKCGHSVLFDWADVQRHLEANYRRCNQGASAGPSARSTSAQAPGSNASNN